MLHHTDTAEKGKNARRGHGPHPGDCGRRPAGLGMVIIVVALALLALAPAEVRAFKPIVLFSTDKLDDGGFVQSAFEGIKSFEKFQGTTVKVVANTQILGPGAGDLSVAVTRAAEEGYDPVVGVGYSFQFAFETICPLFPETRFVIIDTVAQGNNIQSIVFREEEGAYLMGALAGQVTYTGKIGFVGGMDIPLIRKFACAYAQGAKDQGRSVKVLWAMTGTTDDAWENPEKGAELARQMIEQKADVIFHAAGLTGNGVIQAAREAGIFAIGVDSNQNPLAPEIMLTSMLKRTDVAVFTALSQAQAKNWEPGTVSLGIKEGGIDWVVDENNVMLLTDEMQKRLVELTFEIMAEEFNIQVYSPENGCPALDFTSNAGE